MVNSKYLDYINSVKLKNKELFENIINCNHGVWINKYSDFYCESILEIKCKNNHLFSLHCKKLKKGLWCPFCRGSSHYGEELTRIILESLLHTRLVNCRKIKGLVNERNKSLEIDGFCSSLGIGFEYQGMQHYYLNHFFNMTKEAFLKLKNHDQIKKDFFLRNGLKLIVVKEYQNYNIQDILNILIPQLDELGITYYLPDVKEIKNKCDLYLTHGKYYEVVVLEINRMNWILVKGNFRHKQGKIVVKNLTGNIQKLTVRDFLKPKDLSNKEKKYLKRYQDALIAANLCSSLTEFKQKYWALYSWAQYHGLFKIITANIKRFKHPQKFTYNDSVIAAQKYSTKKEFRRNDQDLYLFARKNGYLSKICAHMEDCSSRLKPENN